LLRSTSLTRARGGLLGTGPLAYAAAALAAAAALGLVALVEISVGGLPTAVLLYLVPVILAATRWGRGPAALAAVISVVGHDFFFVEPRGLLTVASLDEALGLALLLFTALVTGQLADAARRTAYVTREALLARRSDEMKTALLRAVSHDLRTPLAAIKANVSGLRDGAPYSDADRAEMLAAVEEEADRLDHLVANLLDLSRIEAGALRPRRRPEDAAELIGTVVRRLRPRLGGRIIAVDVPDDLPPVSCDFGQVDQVLSNLIENAAFHTPPETPIAIAARLEQAMVRVDVRDHGPGIPPAERERLFRPFERGRGAGRAGSGLGLAIARGLVAAHGGRLWVEDADAGGARFSFTLPVDGAAA
jgi:two-component system sensor histidine kinase KdpD